MPHVVDQRGTEADDARPAFAANAGIDDAVRLAGEQVGGELLRCFITLGQRHWLKVLLVFGAAAAKVVEFGGEVGEVVVARGDFFMRPVDLLQLFLFVIADLCEGGEALVAGVPGSALAAVEAAAVRRGVGEGCVDDVGVADSEDQLVDADARQQPFFAEETIVGGAVEFDEGVERGVVLGEAGEDGAGLSVF